MKQTTILIDEGMFHYNHKGFIMLLSHVLDFDMTFTHSLSSFHVGILFLHVVPNRDIFSKILNGLLCIVHFSFSSRLSHSTPTLSESYMKKQSMRTIYHIRSDLPN